MHIKSVEFAGAIGQVGQAAPASVAGLAQVAFSGRSNVGKSSLINRLVGRTRTQLARVSQQPGKTQEINFYRVRSDRGEFALVDLPGYGYAKVPEALRGRWGALIEGYLKQSTALAGVVQLIDVRHGPTPDDLRAVEYLAEARVPVLFALTKADKLRPQARQKAVQEIVQRLGVDADQAIAFSALSGEGRDVLLESLGALLQEEEAPSTGEPE